MLLLTSCVHLVPSENFSHFCKFTFKISTKYKVELSPWLCTEDIAMKPTLVADEMFPEGAGPYNDIEEAGGSVSLLMDLASAEKSVHADFYNDFEDLFDDDDLA